MYHHKETDARRKAFPKTQRRQKENNLAPCQDSGLSLVCEKYTQYKQRKHHPLIHFCLFSLDSLPRETDERTGSHCLVICLFPPPPSPTLSTLFLLLAQTLNLSHSSLVGTILIRQNHRLTLVNSSSYYKTAHDTSCWQQEPCCWSWQNPHSRVSKVCYDLLNCVL